MGAAFGLEMLLVAKVDEGVQAFVDLGDDVAAVTAVAAVRAAARDVFLPTEADAAGAAVAGFDVDFCLIEKPHFFATCLNQEKGTACHPLPKVQAVTPRYSAAASKGSTAT